MKKTCLWMLICGLMAWGAYAAIKVSDVEVFSGYPWTEVVIGYTVTGTDDKADGIRLTATDKSANQIYVTATGSSALTGAALTEGRHIMRWNTAGEGVKFSSSNVVFSVSVMHFGGVQLWKNGPYWAECNVGASAPETAGYWFWWGDTVGYKRSGSSWVSFDRSKTEFTFSAENCPTYGMDYAALKSQGYIDETGNLVPKYDAATKHLGVPWRIPTDAEWEALIANCDTTWTQRNGVRGRLVTGKGVYASKSIFLPEKGIGFDSGLSGASSINDNSYDSTSGNYWSSTPNPDHSKYAWCLEFRFDFFERWGESRPRFGGLSVRPLRGFAK